MIENALSKAQRHTTIQQNQRITRGENIGMALPYASTEIPDAQGGFYKRWPECYFTLLSFWSMNLAGAESRFTVLTVVISHPLTQLVLWWYKGCELELWSTPIQLDTRRRIRLGKGGDDELDGCSTDEMLRTSLGSGTVGGYLWFVYSVIPFIWGYSLLIWCSDGGVCHSQQ